MKEEEFGGDPAATVISLAFTSFQTRPVLEMLDFFLIARRVATVNLPTQRPLLGRCVSTFFPTASVTRLL